MNVFFQPACAQAGYISVSVVTEILEDYHRSGFTGLLQLAPTHDNYYALVLVRGQINSIYRTTAYDATSLPGSKWPEIEASLPSSKVYSLSVTPATLRLARVILEQGRRGERQTVETAELLPTLGVLSSAPQPSAIHMEWDNAEAAAFLPGNKQPPANSAWAASQFLEGVNLFDIPNFWKEPNVQIFRYSASLYSEAWNVYLLHNVFTRLANRCLQKYTELAGSAVTASLCRAASLNAAKNGWDIRLQPLNLFDDEVFANPEAAANAYRSLLNTIVHHIHAVLGKTLLDSIIKSFFQEADPFTLRILQKYTLLPAAMTAQFTPAEKK